jgi:hypothetical protein
MEQALGQDPSSGVGEARVRVIAVVRRMAWVDVLVAAAAGKMWPVERWVQPRTSLSV